MKTRRAQLHFDALERQLSLWLSDKPYSVWEDDDFQNLLHVCRIEMNVTPEAIPMALGDFVCCLRSSLDQLAWQLAHLKLPPLDRFTEGVGRFAVKDERLIQFPIFHEDSTHAYRRRLFPAAVAAILDEFKPDSRGDAYKDHPLWQLNELWTLDKHRTIPLSGSSLKIHFPLDGWETYVRHFNYGIEVHFPLGLAWTSQMELKPDISIEVLFGHPDGSFEIPWRRLGEINDFVRDAVIPKFASFFRQTTATK